MTESQKILDMIEAVDPNDTDTLDEIDARVWCFKYSLSFNDQFMLIKDGKVLMGEVKEYTRSLDASKAVTPDGWFINSYTKPSGFARCCLDKHGVSFISPNISTEELARCHAVVQAIEWDRTNDQ